MRSRVRTKRVGTRSLMAWVRGCSWRGYVVAHGVGTWLLMERTDVSFGPASRQYYQMRHGAGRYKHCQQLPRSAGARALRLQYTAGGFQGSRAMATRYTVFFAGDILEGHAAA